MLTAGERVARQLSIIYGVDAIVAPLCESTDQMLFEMEKALVTSGRVKPGDNVIFLAGQPVNQPGTTNILNLHRVSAHL